MKFTFLLTQLLVAFACCAQTYELNFNNTGWNFKPGQFYFSEIILENSGMNKAGHVLSGGKAVTAVYKTSPESELASLISPVMQPDSNKTPFVLAIEKLVINETGNSSKHKATLDFSVNIYRITGEKKYKVYSSRAKPEMEIRGVYPGAHEKNIRDALRLIIEKFDQWLNINKDLSALARSVVVRFPDKPYTNTNGHEMIKWSSDYKLKWSDFRGSSKPGSFMAQSYCQYGYRIEPSVENGILYLDINMNAFLDRNSSWVRKEGRNDTLLAHEQLHFDICELNVRMLKNRIRMTDLDIMEFESQIKSAFEKTYSEYQEQQNRYDDETEHGVIYDSQFKWQNSIEDSLKKISGDGTETDRVKQ